MNSFGQKILALAEKRPQLMVAIFLLAILGPFLDKAVHNDDSLFVWAAEHILKHPVNFYGFDVNWYGTVEPMSAIDCNPPITSYLFAGAMAMFGEREFVLHSVMLLVAFAAAAGVFQLAKLWCDRPLLVTFIAMSTPVFLVSATTLMCDVPMLAIWIWTLVFWERALRSGQGIHYLCAALLAGLAVLTKYSALTLLPLLPVLAFIRIQRFGVWLLWLAMPVAIIELYQFETAKLYGHGLISAAAGYASQTRFGMTGGWLNKVIIGFAYCGACLLPVGLFAHRLWSLRGLLFGGGLILVTSFIITLATGIGQQFGGSFQIQMSLFLAGGIHVLVLAFAELYRRRDSISLLLLLWLSSGFLFATILNWTVSARSFLPIVPAAAILLVRGLTRVSSPEQKPNLFLVPVVCSGAVSLAVAAADLLLANSGRVAAKQIAETCPAITNKLWFQGHCGFQYYLQRLAAMPVDFSRSILKRDEIMILPSNNSNLITPDAGDMKQVTEFRFPVCSWMSTVNAATGAGFYGAGGLLPYVFGPVPVEQYFVYRTMQTTCFAPPEILNNLAWGLATNPDDKVRNGTDAVVLAQRACEETKFSKTVLVGTLGAAYAEAGRFDEAIATAQQACDLATRNGETNLLQANQKLLELYRAHKPARNGN